jgi:uncharacterized membrane protein
MILDWLSLALRWTHVVAAFAWVGASLYLFSLGERRFEAKLMWPAYATWLAGFALLCIAYYANAGIYLIDPGVMPLSVPAAIAIGIATLVVGLAVYEGLCRSRLGDGAILVFLAAVAWMLTQVFGGRGAFIHYGALLGTIMAGNVAHVAVPVERRRAQALREGREPDAADAARQAQRAGHNAALAIPAIFTMIANHYPVAYGMRWAWLLLVGATLVGGALRGRLART